MKRVVGIFLLAILCMLLGLLRGHFDSSDTTLVGSYEYNKGGVYD